MLLDAAKGCACRPPDLSRHPADFVALSFYKIFGYPTGACLWAEAGMLCFLQSCLLLVYLVKL